MLSKKEIKKLVKRILRRQQGLHDHQMIHPRREWLTGFITGLLLLIAGGAWSSITYQEVGERDVENINVEEVKQTIYRGDIVDSALDEFRDRNEKYRALLNESNTETLEIEPAEDVEEITEPEEVIEEPVPEEVLVEDPVVEVEDEQQTGPPTDAPNVELEV